VERIELRYGRGNRDLAGRRCSMLEVEEEEEEEGIHSGNAFPVATAAALSDK